jgi:hypothetical protein
VLPAATAAEASSASASSNWDRRSSTVILIWGETIPSVAKQEGVSRTTIFSYILYTLPIPRRINFNYVLSSWIISYIYTL